MIRCEERNTLLQGQTTTLIHRLVSKSRLILLSGDVEENPGMVNETRANSTHVNVKIGHLNICSLKNREHYILIRELVMENDFDTLTILETWLNKTVTDVEVEFPGYTIH